MSQSSDLGAVLDPITKGYRAGGATLTLILVCTVLLLAAVAKGPSLTSTQSLSRHSGCERHQAF